MEEKNNLIKKNTKSKFVSKATAIAVTASIATAGFMYASGTFDYMNGKGQIASEFSEVTAEYGVNNSSQGFIITKDGNCALTQHEFNKRINEMIDLAKNAGMSNEEIYIGLSDKISETAAREAFNNSIDIDTIWNTCISHSKTNTHSK